MWYLLLRQYRVVLALKEDVVGGHANIGLVQRLRITTVVLHVDLLGADTMRHL